MTPWETNLYAYVGNDPLGFIDPYGATEALSGGAALGAELLAFTAAAARYGFVAAMAPAIIVFTIVFNWLIAQLQAANQAMSQAAANAPNTGPAPARKPARTAALAASPLPRGIIHFGIPSNRIVAACEGVPNQASSAAITRETGVMAILRCGIEKADILALGPRHRRADEASGAGAYESGSKMRQ